MLMSFDPDNSYLYKNSNGHHLPIYNTNYTYKITDTSKKIFFKIKENEVANTAIECITIKIQHDGNQNYFYSNR